MKKQSSLTCSPRTAVAYARYSSAGQRDVSIEQQLADIRAFAAREGYTIVHEYADHARSGYKNASARTEFQSMISAASSGTFDTVLAWKVDRFGRNREDSAIYKAQLRRLGVSIVYVMEPIAEGAAGVLTEGMLEAIAEWYSRNLSENVTRGMLDNARRCLYNGTRILGYHRDAENKYAITPDEAAVIRRIFQQYTDGYSAARIAVSLNSTGLKTSRGMPFNSESVLRIIRNERYAGTYIWGDIRVPGGMPAIISQEEFDKAQRQVRKAGRPHHTEKAPADYILTGYAFCGLCGESMIGDSGTSKSGASYYYYTCQGHKARKGCKKRSVRKEYLEDLVINVVRSVLMTDEQKEKIADAVMDAQAKSMRSSPLAALETDLKETLKKIDNINDAIEQGIWNSTTSVRLKSLEDTAASLRVSIDELRFSPHRLITRDHVLFFLDQMAAFDPSDPHLRRQLIRTFVNAVYVFDGYAHIVINCVENETRVPLSSIENQGPPCSGKDFSAVPDVTHPNTIVCTVAV